MFEYCKPGLFLSNILNEHIIKQQQNTVKIVFIQTVLPAPLNRVSFGFVSVATIICPQMKTVKMLKHTHTHSTR